jgi:hypothetical protein
LLSLQEEEEEEEERRSIRKGISTKPYQNAL